VRGDRQAELYYWIIGSALFAHVVGFFGISYFDQTRLAWYSLLAMTSAVTLAESRARHTPALKAKFAEDALPETLAGGLERRLGWE